MGSSIFHSPVRQLADWDNLNPEHNDGRAFRPLPSS